MLKCAAEECGANFHTVNGGAYTKVIEVQRKEEGEFERSTCMECVASNRRVETAIA